MSKIIELRIDKSHADWLNNEIYFSLNVVKQMKERGIPVVGHTVVQGVSHGRLEVTIDDKEYVYRWHPAPAQGKVYDPLNDDEDESL